MIKKRKDEIQELYDKCDNIAKFAKKIFVINIILSAVLLCDFKCRGIVIIGSLILNIVYVVLNNINELYFSNIAENERRKSLLKESFNVNTTIRETENYYNNDEKPSVIRLGMNCYESIFFTKKIVDKMMPSQILKMSIIIIIYIVLMIKLENMDVLLIITQTLFSAEVFFSFLKLCYYKFQLDKICGEFENIFFKMDINNKNIDVLILDTTMDYECLKSYCKISISSKIFFNNNEKWSQDWENLREKIQKRLNEQENTL